MEVFEMPNLIAQRAQTERPYLEFLRKSSLSLGLYVLPAGGTDRQQPHTEDEVYYVVSGQGWLRAGVKRQAVGPGSLLFVEAGLEHQFEDISEELTLLVFFAPAEYSKVKNS